MVINLFCAARTEGRQKARWKEQSGMSGKILWWELNIAPLQI